MFKNIGKNLTFKPQNQKDGEFLLSLYASTREDELNITYMSEKQKKTFVKQQFEAKESDYKAKYTEAEFLIINRKKKYIGRIVYMISNKVHLIDIAFIKKSRSQGFGKEILNTLISYAKKENKTFELSVAIDNIKALKLYQKLGLRIIKKHAYYYTMQNLL